MHILTDEVCRIFIGFFLPDESYLSPLAITYIALYHAYKLKNADLIIQVQYIFSLLLSCMKSFLLPYRRKIMWPAIYDNYNRDSGQYFCLNIFEHATDYSGIDELGL